MFLAEILKSLLSASIAFVWTNAVWAKPKPIYVNPQSSHFASGNPYTSSKREQIGFILAEMFSLFLLVLKVIFFSDAKSDISLTGSDIARQSLAVIFYSPKNSRSEYHSA